MTETLWKVAWFYKVWYLVCSRYVHKSSMASLDKNYQIFWKEDYSSSFCTAHSRRKVIIVPFFLLRMRKYRGVSPWTAWISTRGWPWRTCSWNTLPTRQMWSQKFIIFQNPQQPNSKLEFFADMSDCCFGNFYSSCHN